MDRRPHDPRTAGRLATLLLPYRTGGIGADDTEFRFHDAPVDVVEAALALVAPFYLDDRDGGRPPASWVLDACRRHEGRPGGHVTTWRQAVRVDALCVPVRVGRALLAELAERWPDGADVARLELWETWDARQSILETTPADVTAADLARPDAEVLGLWWD